MSNISLSSLAELAATNELLESAITSMLVSSSDVILVEEYFEYLHYLRDRRCLVDELTMGGEFSYL